MVFGEPVYNSDQRKAVLAEFKRYIDELRRKKNPPWKVVKTKRKKGKRIRNKTIKVYKRKKTRKRTKRRGRR